MQGCHRLPPLLFCSYLSGSWQQDLPTIGAWWQVIPTWGTHKNGHTANLALAVQLRGGSSSAFRACTTPLALAIRPPFTQCCLMLRAAIHGLLHLAERTELSAEKRYSDEIYERRRAALEADFFEKLITWREGVLDRLPPLVRASVETDSIAAAPGERELTAQDEVSRCASRLSQALLSLCTRFAVSELCVFAEMLVRLRLPTSLAVEVVEVYGEILYREVVNRKWIHGLEFLHPWVQENAFRESGAETIRRSVTRFIRDRVAQELWLHELQSAGIAKNDDCKPEVPNERRTLIDEYIALVFRKTGARITRTDIWRAAGYSHRREFEGWQRGDAKEGSAIDAAIARVLRQRPHIPPKSEQ